MDVLVSSAGNSQGWSVKCTHRFFHPGHLLRLVQHLSITEQIKISACKVLK